MKKILFLTAAPLALLAGCSSGDQADTPVNDSMTSTEAPAEFMGTTTDGTVGTGTETGTDTTEGTGPTGTGTTETGNTDGIGTGTRTGPDTTPPTDTTDK